MMKLRKTHGGISKVTVKYQTIFHTVTSIDEVKGHEH